MRFNGTRINPRMKFLAVNVTFIINLFITSCKKIKEQASLLWAGGFWQQLYMKIGRIETQCVFE
jgi:hypothetical protein